MKKIFSLMKERAGERSGALVVTPTLNECNASYSIQTRTSSKSSSGIGGGSDEVATWNRAARLLLKAGHG